MLTGILPHCFCQLTWMATLLKRELVFLILQLLDEEKFNETAHMLEKESGLFFSMRYFEEVITNGEWDEAEKYLSGFTKLDDNRYSMKTFFEIRKQKYYEALDRKDHGKAVEILVKDLKVFSTYNADVFKEMTLLLTLPNFRENEQLSKYGDTKSSRAIMLVELKKLIEVNPLFQGKLQFPCLRNSRLRTLINQSLNWQHQLCMNPKPYPDIKTLFTDHVCEKPNGARAPSPVANPVVGSMPKVCGFVPLRAHESFQTAQVPAPIASLGRLMANAAFMSSQAVSGGSIVLSPPANAVAPVLNHPMTPTNIPALDYQTADSEESHTPSLNSSDDLPKTAADGQLQAEVERLKAENEELKAENEALMKKVHGSATHSRGLLQKMQDQESYFTTELSKLTGQIDALDDKVREKEEDVVRITRELAAAETKVRSLDELARANGAERDRLQVAYDKLAKELEEAQELVNDLTYASDHLFRVEGRSKAEKEGRDSKEQSKGHKIQV